MFDQNWNLESDGFAWDSIPLNQKAELQIACELIFDSNNQKFGIRNAVGLSSSLRQLCDEYLLPVARIHLHDQAFLVRSTLFDKLSGANWAVPWHQDVTIEVSEKWETEGYGPWSMKDGFIYT